MEKVISPSLLSSSPRALVLSPQPQLQLAANRPVHLMECPVTVADSEIGAPPIQDRIQLLDHYIDSPVGRKRTHHFARSLADIAARLFTWPQVQHPPCRLPELETQEREALAQRRQPTLLVIHDQAKAGELSLEVLPRCPSLLLRSRQQHHIVRVTDQPNIAPSNTVAPAPLTIYLMQKDVGQQW